MSKRPPIPPKMRARCFELAGGKCELCGVKLTGAWEADHAVEFFYVGAHEQENLQALCRPCHALKTRAGAGVIAKTRRQAGEAGQQARRARRGHGLIRSRGFDKTKSKKFSGQVVERGS